MTTRFIPSPVRILAALMFLACTSSVRAIGNDSPTGVTGDYNGQITTGGSYDPYTGNAKRVVTDLRVTGAVGAYPLAWTRIWNSRGLSGRSWSHSYAWSGTVNLLPGEGYFGPAAIVAYPDGRILDFEQVLGNQYYANLPDGPSDRLVSVANGEYELRMKDGGKVVFDSFPSPPPNPSGSRALRAKAIVDPYGQSTVLTYEGTSPVLLSRITEPAGRYLQIIYDHPSNRISDVKACDQNGIVIETVSYIYNSFTFHGIMAHGCLTDVLYNDGTTATYTYEASNVYHQGEGLLKTCHDVRFDGPMKNIEYEYATGTTYPPVVSGQIKSEKNATTHEAVSSVTYPTAPVGGNCSEHSQLNLRWETRNINGTTSTRTFQYGCGYDDNILEPPGALIAYTDFQDHWSYIVYTDNPGTSNNRLSFTDARSKTTHSDSNPATGVVKEIVYPDQKHVVWTYTDENAPIYVASRKDENDRTTYYDRDGANRIEKIRYPDGGVEEFHYNDNALGQIEWHRMPSSREGQPGGREEFLYDTKHRKWKHKAPPTLDDPTPQPSEFLYYESGPNTDRLRQVIDPRGYSTWYEYNDRGQVTKITHQDGSFSQKGYFPEADPTAGFPVGALAWTADEEHPSAATNPNVRTRYTYDEYGRVLTITNPENETTTFTYGLHNTTWGNPLAHTTGSVKTITTPRGLYKVFGYDENLRKEHEVTAFGKPDETWAGFGYDEVGNLAWTRDGEYNTTTYGYDDRNRKKSETPSHPFSADVTEWIYDGVGNVEWEIKPRVRPGDAPYQRPARRMEYDARNRLWKEHEWADRSNAASERVTTYLYFPSGALKSVEDPEHHTTSFTYDDRNQKLSTTYPDTTTVSGWQYNAVGNVTVRPTAETGVTQQFHYDDRNRPDQMRWSNGIDFADFEYFTTGALKKATNPFATVIRGYDEAGRLKLDRQTLATAPGAPPLPTGLAPPTVVSRQTHGGQGAFDIALPLTGAPGIECRTGGSSRNFTLVATFQDPVTASGASITSGFGSVVGPSASGNTVTVNLTGVSNGQVLTVAVAFTIGGTSAQILVPLRVLTGDVSGDGAVNGDGALNGGDKALAEQWSGQATDLTNFRADVNADGTVNASDRLIVNANAGKEMPSSPLAGPDVAVNYGRDSDGQVGRMYVSAPGHEEGEAFGYDLGYQYDWARRFKRVTAGVGGATQHEYSYDLASNVTGRTHPNGTAQAYGYDERNRLRTAVTRARYNDGQAVYDYEFSREEYAHDSLSRLRLIDRRLRSSPPNVGSDLRLGDSFGYNDTGELTTAQYRMIWNESAQQFAFPGRTVSYQVDDAGNRDLVSDVPGASSLGYIHNLLNQYTTANNASVYNGPQHEIREYDAVMYRYVADQRLASATKGTQRYELGYDALGRCVRRVSNGVAKFYVYDGERPIVEYDGSGAILARNTYGIGIDEILKRDTGTAYYYHQDRLGNVIAITNSGGYVEEQYIYDAFGTPEIRSGPVLGNPRGEWRERTLVGNRFMFTGREWAEEFGFYEYRNRAYHPGLGRFMSEDPKGFAAGDRNLFRYCGGDPVNRVDPMGLEVVYRGADIKDWYQARLYLMRDRGAKELIHTAETIKQKIYIVNIVAKGARGNENKRGLRGQNVIRWDPRAIFVTTEGTRQSPALGVLHELDHAVARAKDPRGLDRRLNAQDAQYGNKEERRVETGVEAGAAKTLGEPRRYDHGGQGYMRTNSSTSTTPTSPGISSANSALDAAAAQGPSTDQSSGPTAADIDEGVMPPVSGGDGTVGHMPPPAARN